MENLIKNASLSSDNTMENKEILVDFKEIFENKLKKIKPLSAEEAKYFAAQLKDPEITEIIKRVPAVFFNPNNFENLAPPTDIWIEDPKNLDNTSYYIHYQVIKKIGEFLNIHTTPLLIPGYIFEEKNKKRYLVLEDKNISDLVKNKLIMAENFDRQQDLDFFNVLNKYNIQKILEYSGEIIGQNLLDQLRGNMALINLAKKYNMTNNQYLRLKILSDSLLKAGTQASLEEIAQSILKDKDNTNIPLKYSSLDLEDK